MTRRGPQASVRTAVSDADNLGSMAGWRNPGRAERVVIYEEGGAQLHYWRAEDSERNVVWRRDDPRAADGSEEAISSEQLLEALAASVHERRSASRGRKFRL